MKKVRIMKGRKEKEKKKKSEKESVKEESYIGEKRQRSHYYGQTVA